MERLTIAPFPFAEGVVLVVQEVGEGNVKGYLARETIPERPFVYIWYLKLSDGTWKYSCQNHIQSTTWKKWTTCSNPCVQEP